MNDRLEIASRIIAGYRACPDKENMNAPPGAVAEWALRDADSLIGQELATQAPCRHERLKIRRRHFYNAELKYVHANVCECGAEGIEVKP